jgi:hypothetical protein
MSRERWKVVTASFTPSSYLPSATPRYSSSCRSRSWSSLTSGP